MFEGLKLIDTDTHWCEPLDVWTARAPERLKDKTAELYKIPV